MRLMLLFIFLLQCCGAFTQEFAIQKLGESDGLINLTCYRIIQDHKEYVWIATNAGMAKYNGREFKKFTTQDGLVDNTIFNLWEDGQGQLFYVTANSKIGFIRNDSCFSIPVMDSLATILENGKYFITDIGDYNENFYLIATQRGFFLLDKKNKKRLIKIEFGEIPGFKVIICNKRSFIGFYNDGKYNPVLNLEITGDKYEIKTEIDLSGNMHGPSVYTSCLLKDGRLIVGFADRALLFNKKNLEYEWRFDTRLINIAQDSMENVWFTFLAKGVWFFEKANFSKRPIEMFKNYSVGNVLSDKEGNTWLPTLNDGILFISNARINHFPFLSNADHRPAKIMQIDQQIYVSTTDHHFYLITGDDQCKLVIGLTDQQIPQTFSDVLKVGPLIYVSGQKQSYIVDSNWKFKKAIIAREAQSYAVYHMVKTSNDVVWGIRHNFVFNVINGQISTEIELPSRGQDIVVNKKDEIFVATANGVYELKGEQFVPLLPWPTKIHGLKIDPTGQLWVCSDVFGLIKFEGKKPVKMYNQYTGLSSNICYAVDFDQFGNKWVGTGGGLCKIDSNEKVFNYTVQNGLPSNFIYKVIVIGNKIYLLTAGGFCMAQSNNFTINKHPPSIYINQVIVNDKIKLVDSTANVFTHNENNVRIIADGVSFTNGKMLTYRYRLIGLSKEWHTTKNGEIFFPNLLPGEYMFEVKAINASGIASSHPACFRFTIRPPFYSTRWFFILCLVGGLTLVGLFLRWRIHLVRKKEKEKTRLNKLMADYQLTALQAQMNPHFIFNAINSIQHYILSNNTQYAYDYLTKFSQLIRLVLNNSQFTSISLKKELEMLELYIELEQRRFKNKFSYTIRIEPDVDPEEIKIPVMLMQPFVENSIWHGIMNLDEVEKGELDIHILLLDENTLKIVIRDNGVGRKKSQDLKSGKKHDSVGTLLSEKRLEIMESTTRQNQRIKILDLFSDDGIATGTQVELYLTII